MKVMALGMRALPDVAGGVESHCEHLYPQVARAGVDVEVLVRSPYAKRLPAKRWQGVRIRRIWSPKKSGLEAIVHTFMGVLYAAVRRPDVLHLHSVGPAIFTPLAKTLGLRVVVTHHASDYLQMKWGRLGRWILRTGERMAMRYAHEVISVSRHGAARLEDIYGRKVIVIRNGVPPIDPTDACSITEELGLERGRYVLHVGRAIPDKRQDDLIRAFARCDLHGWKLVLVGDLSGDDEYSAKIRSIAAGRSDIVLAGFRSGIELHTLFAHAGCFALPSALEGLPIALLEALSAGCTVVCSDIPANHEIELPAECYFEVGNIEAIARALSTIPGSIPPNVWAGLRKRVHGEYNWSRIAEQTVSVYRDCVRNSIDPLEGHARVENPPAIAGGRRHRGL